MPRFIVKPSRDVDEYVEWSSIVESWTFLGDRAETLKYLYKGSFQAGLMAPETRLARADEYGSSSLIGEGRYGDSLIFEQRGMIACAKLSEFCRLLHMGDLQGALRLCEPFEDLDRVRGLEDS